MSPFKQSSFCAFPSPLQVAVPSVVVKSGVDGTYTYLAAESFSYFVNKLWVTNSGTVYAYLVSTGI